MTQIFFPSGIYLKQYTKGCKTIILAQKQIDILLAWKSKPLSTKSNNLKYFYLEFMMMWGMNSYQNVIQERYLNSEM